MADIAREHLQITLYHVEKSSYQSLNIVDRVYKHWILSYVQSGKVVTATGGEPWQVRAGDVMLHPPYLSFSETASVPGTHQWFLCDITVSSDIDLFRLYPVLPVVSISPALSYTSLFDALLATWQQTTPFRNLRTAALVIQLCSIVLESWQQAGSIPRSPALMTSQDRFIDVITYMSEHLDHKLSREELAAIVHLHPGYFDRVFQRIYGLTPMQMLRNMRLQRAQHLLETTDMPLTAIAHSCGLGDAGYLNRIFRERYQQTPGQYRQGAKSTMTSYLSPL